MTTFNRSEIFKTAWRIWRSEGYRYSWSECLKFAWAKAKGLIKTYKSIDVVDWLARKKHAEKGKYLYETRITAIVKETEKAVFGLICNDVTGAIVSWFPKSCLVFNEATRDDFETVRCDSVREAFEIYNDRMRPFR